MMTMPESRESILAAYYHTLYRAWGRQHWWPAQSRFEVIVGAFLTQNTAWINVEHAMRNLRQARALSLAAMRRIPRRQLEQLVRPAGYFRQEDRAGTPSARTCLSEAIGRTQA